MADSPDSWLNDRPPRTIPSESLDLERSHADHLDELVGAVNASLDQLRPWMPWAQRPATAESIAEFLRHADVDWDEGREFQYAMRGGGGGGGGGGPSNSNIGYCGLHARLGMGALEIGYWVRSDRTGHGVATAAAGALARTALGRSGVDRVEIHCDAANSRSAAIPPKLGFHLDRSDRRVPEAPGMSVDEMVWVLPSGAAFSPDSEGPCIQYPGTAVPDR